MNRKTICCIVILALLCLAVSGCGKAGNAPAGPEETPAPADEPAAEPAATTAPRLEGTVRIGVLFDLSAEDGAGQRMLEGAMLAAGNINARDGVGGAPLELVIADHAGSLTLGRQEAVRLIETEQVNALIGCGQADITEAVARVCQDRGVPMITPADSQDRLTDADHEQLEYFFRLCPSDTSRADAMLRFLADSTLHTGAAVRTVAVIADEELSQDLVRGLELYQNRYGINLIFAVDFPDTFLDLTPHVNAVRQANPDAVLCACRTDEAIRVIQAMKTLGYSPRILLATGEGFLDEAFLETLGAGANGVSSLAGFVPDAPNARAVSEDFREHYGYDMDAGAAWSYTAVQVLKTAMETAGGVDGEAVRDAVMNMSIQDAFPDGSALILPCSGITFANYALGENRCFRENILASPAVIQVQNGTWTTVWPQTAARQDLIAPAALQ